jgi:hypothetical protein
MSLLVLVFSYSVQAQPYEPSVIWDRSGETDSSAYGYEILPLGDQNNDGFADWTVYAQGNGGGWHGTRASYLEFFHGGNPPSTQPYMTYHADTTVYNKLWAVDRIGDANGDGYQDWLTRMCTVAGPVTCIGSIFFGGPGADTIPDVNFPASSIGGIGDFNGDGYDDIATYDFGTDVLQIYFGGNPMDAVPDWTLYQPPPGLIQSIPYAFGDFNGDGASDFMCFNPNNYSVAIFLGGANADTIPEYVWTLTGSWPIGGVCSLNGDNTDELVFRGTTSDFIFVHSGNPILSPESNYSLNFSCQGAARSAASAGDFNHDGYSDLLMFTDYCPAQWFGSVNLHLGHPWINPEPAFVINGLAEPLNLYGIWTAAGLGDVNGDSVDDVAIGAYDDLAAQGWRGRCVIIAGDDSLEVSADASRPELPDNLAVNVYPNPFNAETTIRLEAPPNHLVTLTVFNVLGQEVRHEALPLFSGEYFYHFVAENLTSGLYLVHAQSGSLQTTQKLMLLK